MINKRQKDATDHSQDGKPGPQSDFLDDTMSKKIGSHLRDMYDDLVNEPVPDDFLKLLSDADKADS